MEEFTALGEVLAKHVAAPIPMHVAAAARPGPLLLVPRCIPAVDALHSVAASALIGTEGLARIGENAVLIRLVRSRGAGWPGEEPAS